VVGQPSYSIKKIEEFYGKRGTESQVTTGDDSTLRFEEWLAMRTDLTRRDDRILDDLERYNGYDCVSTHGLREWLLQLRAQAAQHFAVDIRPYRGTVTEAPKAETKYPELKSALDALIPEDFDPSTNDPGSSTTRSAATCGLLDRAIRDHRFRDACSVRHAFQSIDLGFPTISIESDSTLSKRAQHSNNSSVGLGQLGRRNQGMPPHHRFRAFAHRAVPYSALRQPLGQRVLREFQVVSPMKLGHAARDRLNGFGTGTPAADSGGILLQSHSRAQWTCIGRR
jgi:hypothetical protein